MTKGKKLPLRRRRGSLAEPDQAGAPAPYHRPRWRSDCEDAPRPCPYVGCRYHLALDLGQNFVKLSFRTFAQLATMEHTCALDVADQGEHTGPDVARLLGVSRQLVSRIEGEAVAKLGSYFRRLPPAVVKEMMPLLRRMLADEGDA